MAHQIEPGVIHATLVRVAGDGQALEAAGRAARARELGWTPQDGSGPTPVRSPCRSEAYSGMPA
ncbi:MAG TPA: hypothetical protein VIG75_10310 [Citricoccus sp.]